MRNLSDWSRFFSATLHHYIADGRIEFWRFCSILLKRFTWYIATWEIDTGIAGDVADLVFSEKSIFRDLGALNGVSLRIS